MKLAPVGAALALAGVAYAGHPDGDKSPACDSLAISDEASCVAYCARDGHVSDYYAGVLGTSCKCDTSAPGEEATAFDFVNVCYTEPLEKEEGTAGDEVEEEEGVYGATAYGSKESARCYCGDVQLACDRIEIECSNGLLGSGSSLRVAKLGFFVSLGAVGAALGYC